MRVLNVEPEKIAALSFYRSQCTQITNHLIKNGKTEAVKAVAANVVTVVKSQGILITHHSINK